MFAKKKEKNLVETIISKNRIQTKKLGMSLHAGQCLQDIYLIKKKINLIIANCVLTNFVKP